MWFRDFVGLWRIPEFTMYHIIERKLSLTLSAPNFRRHLSSVFFFFLNKLSLGKKSLYVKLKDWMSNSVDPDETAHDEPSHLDLCCLQKPIIIACGSERVNADDILKYFPYFSQKTGFGITCKLSPVQIICMKCKNLFFEKQVRKISSICRLLNVPREW